jgi:hypothetical protein
VLKRAFIYTVTFYCFLSYGRVSIKEGRLTSETFSILCRGPDAVDSPGSTKGALICHASPGFLQNDDYDDQGGNYMSYLFKKRANRIKRKAQAPSVENNNAQPTPPLFNTQNKRNQKKASNNSFQDVRKLRRVQLRGWT